MRILFDADVITDFITKREPFSSDAERSIGFCRQKKIQISIAAHTIPNLYYILRKDLSAETRRVVLLGLFQLFSVVNLDAEKLETALRNAAIPDFEDCLQIECAREFKADYIVTRNLKDFAGSVVQAVEPSELLIRLSDDTLAQATYD